MKRILLMILAVMLIIPAFSQRRSRSDEPAMPAVAEGITYSLPMTGIRVVVKARQVTFAPGPYAAYAEQLLGIRDVKTQPQTIWDIEEVHFETFAEPDPAQVYKATGGAAFLQLTPSGTLAGINSSAGTSDIKTVSSTSIATPNKTADLKFNYLIDNPALTGRTSIEQRAIQAANRILRTRDSRFNIATGMLDEFHPDGEAYEESINELQRIENELLSHFIGKSVIEKYVFTFDYLPKTSVRGDVVFRFDENRGFLPKSDLSGKPIMIDVERNEDLASRMSAVKGEQAASQQYTGVYYRVPGIADIRIYRELTVIGTGRAPIAQFGEVVNMPRELLDGTYAIELHPETGAIKSILKK